MSTGYKISDTEGLYYVTLQVVQWVDIFTRPAYRYIIIDSIKYCIQEKGLVVFAYVIMSNHVHMLIQSMIGKLSETLRDMKRHTSKTIIDAIKEGNESRRDWMLPIFRQAAAKHVRNNEYQLWTHENHPELIYSNKFITQKINYIHENPVRSGIVERAEDYLFSSARNYAGLKSLLDVEVIVLPAIVVK